MSTADTAPAPAVWSDDADAQGNARVKFKFPCAYYMPCAEDEAKDDRFGGLFCEEELPGFVPGRAFTQSGYVSGYVSASTALIVLDSRTRWFFRDDWDKPADQRRKPTPKKTAEGQTSQTQILAGLLTDDGADPVLVVLTGKGKTKGGGLVQGLTLINQTCTRAWLALKEAKKVPGTYEFRFRVTFGALQDFTNTAKTKTWKAHPIRWTPDGGKPTDYLAYRVAAETRSWAATLIGKIGALWSEDTGWRDHQEDEDAPAEEARDLGNGGDTPEQVGRTDSAPGVTVGHRGGTGRAARTEQDIRDDLARQELHGKAHADYSAALADIDQKKYPKPERERRIEIIGKMRDEAIAAANTQYPPRELF